LEKPVCSISHAHHLISEETARAAAIGVALNRQHSLGLADAAHDGCNFRHAGLAALGYQKTSLLPQCEVGY
jgi:hypothetical protein